MEVRKPTIRDAKRSLKIYAGADHDPAFYIVWFEGRAMRIKREQSESAAVLWSRVSDIVDHMRQVVRRGNLIGNASAFAHVYAGVMPTEADERERMKEWIVWSLWELTDPQKNDDHVARVEAYCLLAKIYGFMPSEKTDIEINVM